MAEWPKKVGRGWNTSDGYRFFNEEKAKAHQDRVDVLRATQDVVEGVDDSDDS